MTYFVYIVTNDRHTVLYTGVTNSLENRIFDHKVKRNKGSFTAKYNCRNLVYYEEFGEIKLAIHREKQLKKYHGRGRRNSLAVLILNGKTLVKNGLTQRSLSCLKSWINESILITEI